MAGEWIKLAEQPEGPKVARLAALTGATKEMVFCAIVRWFHHVDANYVNGATSIDRETFHDIAHWKPLSTRQRRASRVDLAAAMQDKDVDWLAAGPDGRLTVTRFDSHFGKSAKRRAVEQKRKRRSRRWESEPEPHPPPPETSASEADKKRTPKRTKSGPERERDRSSSNDDDDERAAVAKIFDLEEFAVDDPLRRLRNASLPQMRILVRNADFLARTRGFRQSRRAYFAAGIRDKYPLVEQLVAADREAESVRRASNERDKERAQERAEMQRERVRLARFDAYLGTLTEPQLAELVDRAIAELPGMFKDDARKNRNVIGPEVNSQLRCFAIGIWQRTVDESQGVPQ